MSSMLKNEKQLIVDEFKAYIRSQLGLYRIGKGVREYERAKEKILHADLGTGEYHKALIVIAEWCRI